MLDIPGPLINAPINVKPQKGGGGVGHRWGKFSIKCPAVGQ